MVVTPWIYSERSLNSIGGAVPVNNVGNVLFFFSPNLHTRLKTVLKRGLQPTNSFTHNYEARPQSTVPVTHKEFV